MLNQDSMQHISAVMSSDIL